MARRRQCSANAPYELCNLNFGHLLKSTASTASRFTFITVSEPIEYAAVLWIEKSHWYRALREHG